MASEIKVDLIRERNTGTGVTITNVVNVSPSASGSFRVNSVPTIQLYQNIYVATGNLITGTNLIPLDDTIPQITEGIEFLSRQFTPSFIDSFIEIDYWLCLSHSVASRLTACLFASNSSDALSSNFSYGGAAENVVVGGKFVYPNGLRSVSTITFSVRGGGSAAGTTSLNGYSGARYYGGVQDSFLSIKEYR